VASVIVILEISDEITENSDEITENSDGINQKRDSFLEVVKESL